MLTHQEILLERVITHPKIMNGKPQIRRMRFLVSDVLEMLVRVMAESGILDRFIHYLNQEYRFDPCPNDQWEVRLKI